MLSADANVASFLMKQASVPMVKTALLGGAATTPLGWGAMLKHLLLPALIGGGIGGVTGGASGMIGSEDSPVSSGLLGALGGAGLGALGGIGGGLAGAHLGRLGRRAGLRSWSPAKERAGMYREMQEYVSPERVRNMRKLLLSAGINPMDEIALTGLAGGGVLGAGLGGLTAGSLAS